jgi:uncharacterized protein YkwD
MIRIRACLVLVGALALSLGAPAGEEKKPFASPDEVRLLELTNAERKKKDLPPLTLSPLLCKIARAHSENMARQKKMDHKLDNKSPFDRMRDAGYQFRKGGENIAMGEAGAGLNLIMKAWMESPLHRKNIMEADFTEIGLGVAPDRSGQFYITQLFARPRSE